MLTLNHSISGRNCVAYPETSDLAVATSTGGGLSRFVAALLSALSALAV